MKGQNRECFSRPCNHPPRSVIVIQFYIEISHKVWNIPFEHYNIGRASRGVLSIPSVRKVHMTWKMFRDDSSAVACAFRELGGCTDSLHLFCSLKIFFDGRCRLANVILPSIFVIYIRIFDRCRSFTTQSRACSHRYLADRVEFHFLSRETKPYQRPREPSSFMVLMRKIYVKGNHWLI